MEQLLEPIQLTADQVESLAIFECDEPRDQSEYPEYKGWYIFADTDDGDFDSEKGAMTEFKLELYDNEDKLMGTGRGGYYTGITGMRFNYPVTFTPPKPKKPKARKTTIKLENVQGNWGEVGWELFGTGKEESDEEIDATLQKICSIFEYGDFAELELTIDSNLKVTGKVIPFKN